MLARIQNEMFDLGADVATPGEIEGALRIVAAQVDRLKREIDAMNATLEPLTSFILPGGSAAVSALHLARAVSAAPSARRSRCTSRSRSTRTCSPTSTACRTICSSPRALSPGARAATCCGSPERPGPRSGSAGLGTKRGNGRCATVPIVKRK